MFWFGKKATVKRTIELKHKDGDIVKIIVEGDNVYQVDYVEKRIKNTFFTPRDSVDVDVDKVFEGAGKVFEEMDKFFKGMK